MIYERSCKVYNKLKSRYVRVSYLSAYDILRFILHCRINWLKIKKKKKGKSKVQGVPQLQTAALPRPQEEEETDKSKQARIEQTYEKH